MTDKNQTILLAVFSSLAIIVLSIGIYEISQNTKSKNDPNNEDEN